MAKRHYIPITADIECESERAKALLRETDLTIREIGMRVGYYDAGSFIRRFKQVTGETPLQYRRGRGIRNEEADRPEEKETEQEKGGE